MKFKANKIIANYDTDDDKPIISRGQNVLKYKSKVKSNSKYVSYSGDDLDELDDLDDLDDLDKLDKLDKLEDKK